MTTEAEWSIHSWKFSLEAVCLLIFYLPGPGQYTDFEMMDAVHIEMLYKRLQYPRIPK